SARRFTSNELDGLSAAIPITSLRHRANSVGRGEAMGFARASCRLTIMFRLPQARRLIRCVAGAARPALRLWNPRERKSRFAERIQTDLGRPVLLAKIIRFSGR